MTAIGIADNSTVYYGSTAYEITGIQIWDAVDSFVTTLKTFLGLTLGVNNLSTVFDALYPFIGGSSTTHKFNLVNPLDSDAAFRLLLSGGWTHGATGMDANGTNAYANTFWDSQTMAATNRVAFGGYYNTACTFGLSGTWDLNNPTRLYDTNASAAWTIGSTGGILYGAPLTRFHGVAVRAASTKSFANGSIITNAGALTYTTVNKPFYIGARNNNNASINQYTDGIFSFYFLTGKVELTDTNMTDLDNAVAQLQSDLFRNV